MNHFSHDKKYTPHAAHVVHHYADGARSLGLTEKEIQHQIDIINEQQKCETNEQKRNSPYAKPMAMIPPIAKTDEYKKKFTVMARNNEIENLAIWRDTPIINYHVDLPSITVKEEICAENLKLIRKKTYSVKNDYRIKLSKVQKDNSDNLWSTLRYQNIPNERLKDILKCVYGAYTTNVRMQPLKWSSTLTNNNPKVFSDIDSDGGSSGLYDFLEPYSQAPFIRKKKMSKKVKKID